jgi:glucuronoarabinoxylan endo-1,4-beta-xylanase
MNFSHVAGILVISVLILAVNQSAAQNVTVTITSEKQNILGFGGMNCPTWGVDLTADQRTTAFGNGQGQLGMTILRLMVPENSGSFSRELPTAKRAVELGATVYASPWNPPSTMGETVNGKRHLKTSMYADYANHLNSFVTYMKNNGVNLYAISVQNEPDYGDWTQWSAQEIVTFLKQNASVIQTKVIAPESFQYRKVMSDPILNDATALANMDILGAHLYGTQVRDFPYPLFKEKGAGKELWMTEVYTDSKNDADLWPMALDVATNIHNAMVEAEFNVYTWWYIRRSYGMIKENGQISKRGWCMAQYTKFVRPGFKRVDATKSPTTNVYVSAYKGGDQLVIVAVNTNTSSKTLTFSLNGARVTEFTQYTTSSSKNLASGGTISVSGSSFSATIDAQSVATWVGNGTYSGIKNQGSENRTLALSPSAEDFSECTMYNLRGRLISGNLKNSGPVQNRGLYIIRSNKSGGIRFVNVLSR